MGDGNYYKDGRIRIYTNYYSYDECIILRNRIREGCGIQCEVLFDRIGSYQKKQYILTIAKSELKKVQTILMPHMHNSMLYRIGLLFYLNKTPPHIICILFSLIFNLAKVYKKKVLSPNKTG